MTDETRQVDIIMGPYRDQRLTMTTADADAAVNAHWARDPVVTYDPDHEPHDPLNDQQRQDALTAAHTWAKAQWDAAQKVPDQPPEGEAKHQRDVHAEKRDMKPEDAEAYKTRQSPAHDPRQPQPKR